MAEKYRGIYDRLREERGIKPKDKPPVLSTDVDDIRRMYGIKIDTNQQAATTKPNQAPPAQQEIPPTPEQQKSIDKYNQALSVLQKKAEQEKNTPTGMIEEADLQDIITILNYWRDHTDWAIAHPSKKYELVHGYKTPGKVVTAYTVALSEQEAEKGVLGSPKVPINHIIATPNTVALLQAPASRMSQEFAAISLAENLFYGITINKAAGKKITSGSPEELKLIIGSGLVGLTALQLLSDSRLSNEVEKLWKAKQFGVIPNVQTFCQDNPTEAAVCLKIIDEASFPTGPVSQDESTKRVLIYINALLRQIIKAQQLPPQDEETINLQVVTVLSNLKKFAEAVDLSRTSSTPTPAPTSNIAPSTPSDILERTDINPKILAAIASYERPYRDLVARASEIVANQSETVVAQSINAAVLVPDKFKQEHVIWGGMELGNSNIITLESGKPQGTRGYLVMIHPDHPIKQTRGTQMNHNTTKNYLETPAEPMSAEMAGPALIKWVSLLRQFFGKQQITLGSAKHYFKIIDATVNQILALTVSTKNRSGKYFVEMARNWRNEEEFLADISHPQHTQKRMDLLARFDAEVFSEPWQSEAEALERKEICYFGIANELIAIRTTNAVDAANYQRNAYIQAKQLPPINMLRFLAAQVVTGGQMTASTQLPELIIVPPGATEIPIQSKAAERITHWTTAFELLMHDIKPYDNNNPNQEKPQTPHERIFGSIAHFMQTQATWGTLSADNTYKPIAPGNDQKAMMIMVEPGSSKLKELPQVVTPDPEHNAVFIRPEKMIPEITAATMAGALTALKYEYEYNKGRYETRTETSKQVEIAIAQIEALDKITEGRLRHDINTLIAKHHLETIEEVINFEQSAYGAKAFQDFEEKRLDNRAPNSKYEQQMRIRIFFETVALLVSKKASLRHTKSGQIGVDIDKHISIFESYFEQKAQLAATTNPKPTSISEPSTPTNAPIQATVTMQKVDKPAVIVTIPSQLIPRVEAHWQGIIEKFEITEVTQLASIFAMNLDEITEQLKRIDRMAPGDPTPEGTKRRFKQYTMVLFELIKKRKNTNNTSATNSNGNNNQITNFVLDLIESIELR